MNIFYAGSSHFSQYRNFVGETMRSNYHPRVNKVLTMFGSGAYLEDIFTKKIMDTITEFPTNQTLVIVVMLSCNWVRARPTDVDFIYQAHCTLLDLLGPLNHTRLLIAGLLPCPRTHWYTRAPFQDLDARFSALASIQGPKVKFFNTAQFFTKQGSRDKGQIKNYLFGDRLHLNEAGGDVLTRELHLFILENY